VFFLYSRVPKLRERLAKHRSKIAEMETQALAMEQEIKAAEDEQLGYLARSVANTLTGGMEEIFELLRNMKTNNGTAADKTITPPTTSNKEGDTID
jgi:hypothetical protein